MKHALLFMALMILSGTGIADDDWTRFRGNDGNASLETANVPLEWDDVKNIKWKSDLKGNGSSSPVVFDDRIYLTTYSGYALDPDQPGDRSNLQLHVLCFDYQSGQQLWDYAFAASENEQNATRRVVDHGFATGTPACDESGVYCYFGVSGLVALSHDGKLKWKAQTGDKTAGFGSAASPVVYQNLVIVNASIESGTVFAFDRSNGTNVWKINDIAKTWTTPIVAKSADGRDELLLSYKMFVKGIDPLTGKQLWSCDGVQDYVVPCVVVNDGIAYVLGGRKNQSMAIRMGGSGNVTDTHTLWSTNIGANVTSPIFHNDRLYWASDRGIANCLDAKTGESIYKARMDTRERVYASTVLAGDRMYLTTRENGIFAVSLSDEYEVLAHNVFKSDDSLLNATPTVTSDSLIIRTNNRLYRISDK